MLRFQRIAKLKEAIEVVQMLTPGRIWNIFLLWISYRLSLLFRSVIHWGKPFALSFEPTTSCNLRCPECPSGLRSFSRPTGMLDHTFYKKVIDQCTSHLSYLILYFQGEPFLHPGFTDLIQYANQKGIYTATSTNAHFLNDDTARKTIVSGLKKIIISIDGTDQDTYEKYRIGGDYEKVVAGIRRLIHWRYKLNRRNPRIILQFLVFSTNQHQIQDIKKLGRALMVDDVDIKTAQIYNLENASTLVPDDGKFNRYKKVNGKYRIKNELKNQCWRSWSSSVITWDGKVVPCCFDKDAQYVYGDLNESSFSEIWSNIKVTGFRAKILDTRSNIDICRNCTEGSKVFAN